jgi:dTDP-4-amino-4,6-dideoxygalactose transaminase
MINVTKTYLPPFEEYTTMLKRAWDNVWITNNGELVKELEQKLKEYLGLQHLLFCNNGTIVLQMALKALNITGEVITTPFSYVATTNAILWEGCTPVFVDIDQNTFCIDPSKIEAAITPNTQAIMATHVYGLACDVVAIEQIALKHNLKVIYDAAHAFGCVVNGKSLLSYGDISTCSFHATKLFHSGEGGCIVVNDDDLAHRLLLYRQFGHIGDDYFSLGINGKNSEFHAAMGLCMIGKVDDIIENRKERVKWYNEKLDFSNVTRPEIPKMDKYNYAYYPIVLETEDMLLKVRQALQEQGIIPRRYFFPSLNKLPFVANAAACPISENIAQRVLALPLYYDLSVDDIEKITGIINSEVND